MTGLEVMIKFGYAFGVFLALVGIASVMKIFMIKHQINETNEIDLLKEGELSNSFKLAVFCFALSIIMLLIVAWGKNLI